MAEGGAGSYLSHSCCMQMFCLCSRTDHLQRKHRALCQSAETEGSGLGPGSSQGELACFYKKHLAVLGAGYLVLHLPWRENRTLSG